MQIQERKTRLASNTFTYLFLIGFTIFTFIPAWWILNLSFEKSRTLVSTVIHLLPQNFTFDNYIKVFSDPDFVMWFRNSCIFSFGTTITAVIIALLAAYGFSRFSFPGKRFGMLMFIVFMMLPITATLLPQYLLIRALHLTNTYFGMIIIYVAGSQTFAVWNLKGYFDTIPRELDEAATVDGAGRLRIFFEIILPLSKPALAITIVITFLGPWTDFAGVFMFLSDPHKYTLAMGLQKWGSDFRAIPWPIFAAGSFVVAGPITMIYLGLQKYVVSGLTIGSVKG
jgi:arabinogalactan oligomer / maltooligosaccharide transport system permease protein